MYRRSESTKDCVCMHWCRHWGLITGKEILSETNTHTHIQTQFQMMKKDVFLSIVNDPPCNFIDVKSLSYNLCCCNNYRRWWSMDSERCLGWYVGWDNIFRLLCSPLNIIILLFHLVRFGMIASTISPACRCIPFLSKCGLFHDPLCFQSQWSLHQFHELMINFVPFFIKWTNKNVFIQKILC